MTHPLLAPALALLAAPATDVVEVPLGAAPGSGSPRLVADGDGALLSWLEPAAGGEADAAHALRFARIARADDGWRVDAGAVFERRERLFANWADVPGVWRSGDGALVAHWLERSADGPYTYDVQLARSVDGGAAWTPLGPLNDDGVAAEHGFASAVPTPDGLLALYLDGRETAGGGHGHGGDGDGDGGRMTLRAGVVGERPQPTALVDPSVCDCCNTATALTADGPVVAYRDRSAEGEVRDVAVARRVADGWTEPVVPHPDGWSIPGCPVNGPALASDGAARLALAWYTEAPTPRVRVAFSDDAGASFRPATTVAVSAGTGGVLGRVALALLPDGGALLAHLTADDGAGAVELVRVAPGGDPRVAVGEPLVAAAVSAGRDSGFPQLAVVGDSALLAVTGEGGVRLLAVPLGAVPRPVAAASDGAGSGG